MKHEMHLNDEPFEMIKDGRKVIEARINDPKRQSLNLGDQITILRRSDEADNYRVEVVGLSRYKTFLDMFTEITPVKFGFNLEDSAEDAASWMRKYYPIEEEVEFGVLGIHVKVV